VKVYASGATRCKNQSGLIVARRGSEYIELVERGQILACIEIIKANDMEVWWNAREFCVEICAMN